MKTKSIIAIACLALLIVATANLRATTITVTTTADSGPGSLREALASAADGDTIDATAVSGTILLIGGPLGVFYGVTILGPGPTALALDGDAANRVFEIRTTKSVTIANLTITNGRAEGDGGGILNINATLTVSNCVLRGNSAIWSGGAIANTGWFGYKYSAMVVNSTLKDNSATWGGGLYNFSGPTSTAIMQVVNSTLSANAAEGVGGGIFNVGDCGTAKAIIFNSTISGNSATNAGGGIMNLIPCADFPEGATTEILNSTLSGNFTANPPGGGGTINNSSGTIKIGNSILNTRLPDVNILSYGTVTSLGYNLSSDAGVEGWPPAYLDGPGDQINTNPWLGPLQDNGGPTFTHAPLACSAAIDQGKNLSASTTDQRGLPRPSDYPGVGNSVGGDGTDIGAVEVQSVLVDTTPPMIICPADIVTFATTRAQTVVNFAPNASDNCSLASVTCTPPSGSTFPVGTTTVTCQTTDGVELTSSCTFTVLVAPSASSRVHEIKGHGTWVLDTNPTYPNHQPYLESTAIDAWLQADGTAHGTIVWMDTFNGPFDSQGQGVSGYTWQVEVDTFISVSSNEAYVEGVISHSNVKGDIGGRNGFFIRDNGQTAPDQISSGIGHEPFSIVAGNFTVR